MHPPLNLDKSPIETNPKCQLSFNITLNSHFESITKVRKYISTREKQTLKDGIYEIAIIALVRISLMCEHLNQQSVFLLLFFKILEILLRR